MRQFYALCALVLATIAAAPASSTPPARSQTWLVISDIHLNQYDRSGDPALMGSDTNLELFRQAVAQMKHYVPNPTAVLLPGDFFVHSFARVVTRSDPHQTAIDGGISTMKLIASTFNRAYPRARFAPTVGNNDAPCGDYRSDLADPYQRTIARIWNPLVDRDGAAPDFLASFSRAGYYTAALPVRGLRLLVLNTVLFSSTYHGGCPDGDSAGAPARELRWLTATLGATPTGTRNVVMMHIPPGFDAFSTETIRGYLPWSFLNGRDNTALVNALSDPKHRVAYAIAGHTHRFDFRILGSVPMLIAGSVSPVYHNNPAFYALHVDANGDITDIDEFAYDEWSQEWQPPRSFDEKWNVAGFNAKSLVAIHAQLENDPDLRREWDAQSAGWPSNMHAAWALWRRFWRVPWCAQTITGHGFTSCAHLEQRVTVLIVAVAAGLCVAAAIAGAVIVAIRRRKPAGG